MWRLRVNSTLKSLLFWTVLFVIGVLIWNVSTKFQRQERRVSFSEFMTWVDQRSVASVEIVGQDVKGVTKANEQFYAYVPTQYEGLANKLMDAGVKVSAKEPTASPWASLLLG